MGLPLPKRLILKIMRHFTKIICFCLCMAVMSACNSDPEESAPQPTAPTVQLLQNPETVTLGESITVIAKVTNSGQSWVTSVKLLYGTTPMQNDGSSSADINEIEMSSTGEPSTYEAELTPTNAGKLYYRVSAANSDGLAAASSVVTLTVSEESPIEPTPDPATELILSEIGTFDQSDFIEIYNPTTSYVSLDSVALYKNGELLVDFTGKNLKLPSQSYGVYQGKETALTLPVGVTDLGSTTTGFSGSKSLSIELRVKNKTTDAFANTANPNVEASAWDAEVEILADFFCRNIPEAGWYVAQTATPGADNTPSLTQQLKHQLLEKDAVPDKPYVTNIQTNPENVVTGTPFTLTAEVYTDRFSSLQSINCFFGLQSFTMTAGENNVYSFSHTVSQEGLLELSVAATNNEGEYRSTETIVISPAGTEFGTQSDIRLNEIDPNAKFIELINTADKPVNISGMTIRKNDEKIFTVADNTLLPANGFALLGCKDVNHSDKPGLYLGTVTDGISGKKSLFIELRDRDKNTIDRFTNTSETNPTPTTLWDGDIEALIEVSVGRANDAGDQWFLLSTSTPGVSNATAVAGTELKNQMQ